MKIVVCIKQVPDTVEVKIDPKTGTLIRDGVPSIINHDDKTGIEAALQLKEQLGGTVTVVSMGPPQADVALREALAMGCDEAYLVSAREFGGSDTYATSGIIAAALKKIGYDLIITGRQAIDGDTAQVGPQIAEQLGIPLGNLTGLSSVSGWGPTVPVRVVAVAHSDAAFENTFSAAGINQTLHQVMLDITVTVRILIPGETVETVIDTRVCVAETVVVGEVPGTYLELPGSSQ